MYTRLRLKSLVFIGIVAMAALAGAIPSMASAHVIITYAQGYNGAGGASTRRASVRAISIASITNPEPPGR